LKDTDTIRADAPDEVSEKGHPFVTRKSLKDEAAVDQIEPTAAGEQFGWSSKIDMVETAFAGFTAGNGEHRWRPIDRSDRSRTAREWKRQAAHATSVLENGDWCKMGNEPKLDRP